MSKKELIGIYCTIICFLLYIPPVYRQLPRGFISRAQFPKNHMMLHDILGQRLIEIDWSILLIEVLIVTVVACGIYFCFIKKDKK